jgi:hypothetical protein
MKDSRSASGLIAILSSRLKIQRPNHAHGTALCGAGGEAAKPER